MLSGRSRVKKIRISLFVFLIAANIFVIYYFSLYSFSDSFLVEHRKSEELDSSDLISNLSNLSDSHKEFINIPSEAKFDPIIGKTFIISMLVSISKDKKESTVSERLVYKFASKESPYPGWAIYLKYYPTSMRPEVYWRDRKGGSWYSFDVFPDEVGNNFYLTFIAVPLKSISLYVQSVNKGQVGNKKIFFLGGYDVSNIGLPTSQEALYIRPIESLLDNKRVILGSVLMAQIDRNINSISDLDALIQDGSKGILSRLQESEVSLFIDESMQSSAMK